MKKLILLFLLAIATLSCSSHSDAYIKIIIDKRNTFDDQCCCEYEYGVYTTKGEYFTSSYIINQPCCKYKIGDVIGKVDDNIFVNH